MSFILKHFTILVTFVVMKAIRRQQSQTLHVNILIWKFLGLWDGRTPTKYYKYYSFFILTLLFIYHILLTMNIYYTPRKIELLIRELMFYFTTVTVTTRVLTIILMKVYIVEAFDILDCEEFLATTTADQKIIDTSVKNYNVYWKAYSSLIHIIYVIKFFVPILMHFFLHSNVELPIFNFYFLSDKDRETYFVFWYIYQSVGTYCHMICNINMDCYIAGMLIMAITQVKVLQHKLERLKLTKEENKLLPEIKERIQMVNLNNILRHYEVLLKYCKTVQDIISVIMFVQFGITSAIICVILCGLLMPSSTETKVFLLAYFTAMMNEIFVPVWLGAILSTESQKLAFSAYESEWIPRSERFKRSLRLFVERANKPIILSGMNMVPLSLETFTTIMKTAYSFFTLVRNVQNRQN